VKFLLVEFWHSLIYADAFFKRLGELGHEVHAFKELDYFQPTTLSARAQNKFRWGPRVGKLNRDLRARARQIKPDVLFVFRGEHIFPETLSELRAAGSHVIGWHNDDPFSARYPRYVWRHFRRSIPVYERLFAYREANVRDFLREGCPRASMLRSFYLREVNFPLDAKDSPYRCEVSFVGHWEPDGRERYVRALIEDGSFQFRLWGTLWERSPIAGMLEQRFGQVRPVLYEEYNRALNASKISVAFLSKLNSDTYTRRNFEIPASGSFMLSQYTDDLATLFREGEEAEYFRSEAELLDKVKFYLRNESARARIAAAGRARVLRDGHEAIDRAKQVVRTLEQDLGHAPP
jgi:spore maturation protein CgeB